LSTYVDKRPLFDWSFSRGDNSENVKIQGKIKKKSSSPEPLGQFHSNMVQIILGGRGFRFALVIFKGR
jgi:hypothetical protein